MPKRKTLKCPKCDRKFSMAAHLARHQNTMHGGRKKATATMAKRRPTTRMTKRLGRPRGVGGLQDMSLDQLMNLIDSAREEARSRLAELESVFA